MNRIRQRFVTKPLAVVLSVVFLLTNVGGGNILLCALLRTRLPWAFARSLHLRVRHTTSPYR